MARPPGTGGARCSASSNRHKTVLPIVAALDAAMPYL
jgi:hypothetical protein